MNATRPHAVVAKATTAINGDADTLAVERAIAELRRGRVIGLAHEGGVLLLGAVETLADTTFSALCATPASEPRLALSKERAVALGVGEEARDVVLNPGSQSGLEHWRALAGLDGKRRPMPAGRHEQTGDVAVVSALRLARSARLMPALVILRTAAAPVDASLLVVSLAQVESYRERAGRRLEVISRAQVPLHAEENCELVLFRDPYADNEHLAIVVGTPERSGSVLTRLHSACLTGDVLGSLRCDCGDQLRGSVQRMSEDGGGVLLYLAQEGRGIGLANKLRAYTLQDTGLDTYDADQQLGFGPDQRDFGEAATMLRTLGIDRIRLLTNNPHKVEALRAAGIVVEQRLALRSPRNPHNSRYLHAKKTRAGHLVDDPGDSAAG